MYTVTFSFDLGDCEALYTGRIIGSIDHCYLVTYYEPTVRELLTHLLPKEQAIGRGFSSVRMLPLSPVVVEKSCVESQQSEAVRPIYA